MATRSIISKNIAESSSTYTGVDGELILDTVTNTLKVSDGTTAGGVDLTTITIEYLNDAGSTNSGSPTALDSTKTLSIIDHKDGTVRYYSVADGTTNGQKKIVRYADSAGGGGGSSRILSGNFDGTTTFSLGSSSSATFIWRTSKWYCIAESDR